MSVEILTPLGPLQGFRIGRVRRLREKRKDKERRAIPDQGSSPQPRSVAVRERKDRTPSLTELYRRDERIPHLQRISRLSSRVQFHNSQVLVQLNRHQNPSRVQVSPRCSALRLLFQPCWPLIVHVTVVQSYSNVSSDALARGALFISVIECRGSASSCPPWQSGPQEEESTPRPKSLNPTARARASRSVRS